MTPPLPLPLPLPIPSLGTALLGTPLQYGIPHTGIFVHGYEWFYGGGIRSERPEAITAQMGLRPMERQTLGRTSIDIAALRTFLASPIMLARFSPNAYDIMSNNCNNFSDTVAKFLLAGCGIPSSIVDLPQRVAATPLGGQIMAMWGSAAGAVRGDPFGDFRAGGGGGGGGDPFVDFPGATSGDGATASAGGRSAPLSTAAPPPPSAPPSTAAPPPPPFSSSRFTPSNVLRAPPLVTTYVDFAGAAIVGARLRKAQAAASEATAGAPLTRAESAFADTLPAAIAAGGDWPVAASALACRVLKEWPRAEVAFPGLLLARLALAVEHGGANSDSDSDSDSGTLPSLILDGFLLENGDVGWGSPAASNQALCALVNAVAFRKGWALRARARLVEAFSRQVSSPRADLRAIAAALGDALARHLAPADATDGCVVHLLAVALGGVEDEAVTETATRRLLAAGILCVSSPGVVSLAGELGLDASAIAIEMDVSRPSPLRALAAEVAALIRGGTSSY